MFLAFGKGVLRSLLMDPQKSLDIIPSDFVVNGIIAAAWKMGTSKLTGRNPTTLSPVSSTPILSMQGLY